MCFFENYKIYGVTESIRTIADISIKLLGMALFLWEFSTNRNLFLHLFLFFIFVFKNISAIFTSCQRKIEIDQKIPKITKEFHSFLYFSLIRILSAAKRERFQVF